MSTWSRPARLTLNCAPVVEILINMSVDAQASEILSVGRIDFYSTPLGRAVFEGDFAVVDAAIAKGIDWAVEKEYPLEAAIYGKQTELAGKIIAAGSPISDLIYKMIFHYGDHALFSHLPPRPDILGPLQLEVRWHQFNSALIEKDLARARALVLNDRINEASDILGAATQMRPIHYAARTAQVSIIDFVLNRPDVEINALNGEGKSALRVLVESPSPTDRERVECIRLLQAHGALCIPPIEGWFRRWQVMRGAWLRS